MRKKHNKKYCDTCWNKKFQVTKIINKRNKKIPYYPIDRGHIHILYDICHNRLKAPTKLILFADI